MLFEFASFFFFFFFSSSKVVQVTSGNKCFQKVQVACTKQEFQTKFMFQTRISKPHEPNTYQTNLKRNFGNDASLQHVVRPTQL